MTFDTATHVFGMAYQSRRDDGIFYPHKFARVYPGKLHMTFQFDAWMAISDIDLIRAPEHDYVPVAVADKMRDALTDIVDGWKPEPGAINLVGKDFTVKIAAHALQSGAEALTEYAASRGETK